METSSLFPWTAASLSCFTGQVYLYRSQGLCDLYAVFINEGIPQTERLAKLNAIAISQMKVLTEDHRMLQFNEAKETES